MKNSLWVKHYLESVQRKLLDDGIVFYPEEPATLLNQYYRLVARKKPIMLFTKIREHMLPPELLKDVKRHRHLDTLDSIEGVFVYNVKLVLRKEILLALYHERLGSLLCYGHNHTPEDTFVLTLVNRDGVEKEAISCSQNSLDAVTDALMKFVEEGDRIKALTHEEFRQMRLSKFRSTAQ